MAPVVLGHAMAAAGIDDDFFVLWPPLVLGALRSVISTSPKASSRPWPPQCPGDALPPSPPSGTGCVGCSPRPEVTTLRPSRRR